jgi:hypothetical protein
VEKNMTYILSSRLDICRTTSLGVVTATAASIIGKLTNSFNSWPIGFKMPVLVASVAATVTTATAQLFKHVFKDFDKDVINFVSPFVGGLVGSLVSLKAADIYLPKVTVLQVSHLTFKPVVALTIILGTSYLIINYIADEIEGYGSKGYGSKY